MLRNVARLTTGVLMLAVAVHALAAAPFARTSAPGWYRMTLGDFEITALSDGTVALPVTSLLTNTTPANVKRALGQSFIADPVETSVNGYLINTGDKLVLIDAGAGALFGPTLGRLVDNLKASGYQPEQVDEIYITHLHADHVGGLIANNRIVFPHAIVRVDKRDTDYWLSTANRDVAPKDMQEFFDGAMASLNPYVSAGKLKTFDGDTELVSGIRARAARGHTPGHASYVVESKGRKLVVWGDLIHVGAVQFAEPQVTIKFDIDSKAALPQRRRAFAEAAKEGHWVAAAHIAFPGIGHLRALGKGYVWVPANYSNIR
ncbi:MAG TPA: MBL fold metallo-hydrolase [Casimicrobiaceae bacterium]|nr:MBL fold metallo-hydrolase [Casimicrobiaceae bacterium]